MTYDDESRLCVVTYPHDGGSATDYHWYNALGQRTRAKLQNDAQCISYVYNGERVLEEDCLTGSWIGGRYATESGSYFAPLLQFKRATGESRFPLYDGIGTVRGLADAAGNVTDLYTLDTFGNLRSSTGTTPNPYKYGGAWGYITDTPGSGMLQLGQRYYWPEIGRFVHQDPLGDGMNWYAYVGNNPVTRIDPTGQVSFGIDLYAGIGMSLTIGYNPGNNSWFVRTRAGVGIGVGGTLDPCDTGRGAAAGVPGSGAAFGVFETAAVGYGRGSLPWEAVAGNAYDNRGNYYPYNPRPGVSNPVASFPKAKKVGFAFAVGAEGEFFGL